MTRDRATAILTWCAARRAALVATGGLLGLLLLLPDYLRFFAYPHDDGLAYGLLAANTAHGMPFSLDGLSRTTGFHWAGMLVPLVVAFAHRFLVGPAGFGDLFAWFYPVDCVVFVVMSFVTSTLFDRVIERRGGGLVSFGFAVAWLGCAFGMEVVFLPALLLLALLAGRAARNWYPFLVAVATAIVRIDVTPVVVLLVLVAAHHGARPWRRSAAVGGLAALGALVGGLVVGGLNWLVGGHVLSTAVLTKGYLASVSRPSDLYWHPARAATGVLLGVCLLAVRPRYRTPALRAAVLGGAILYVQVAWVSAVAPGVGYWYLVFPAVLWPLPLVAAVSHIRPGTVRRAAAGLAVGLLAFPGEGPVLENVRALKTTFERGQDLGARVRRATGATDRVAVNDYPFAVAYLTGRPTVALDGSMNGVGFVRDYLARQREAEFVRSRADYVLVLVKAGAVASATSDGRGRSWTYALGQPGPFRKAIGVSQFSFGEEQVVFRLGSSWEGYDDVWLVRVASDTRR